MSTTNNSCFICGSPLVDYYTDENKLICGDCNIGLWHFNSDINLLIRAAIYLKKLEQGEVNE